MKILIIALIILMFNFIVLAVLALKETFEMRSEINEFKRVCESFAINTSKSLISVLNDLDDRLEDDECKVNHLEKD